MSIAVSTLFDNKSLCNTIKSQLKTIKKHKVDSEMILTELRVRIKNTYSSSRTSLCSLIVKVDKKKDISVVEDDLRNNLIDLINNSDINVDYLFSINRHSPQEIIVKIRRSSSQ